MLLNIKYFDTLNDFFIKRINVIFDKRNDFSMLSIRIGSIVIFFLFEEIYLKTACKLVINDAYFIYR